MVREKCKNESREPRPVFVSAAAIIFTQLLFSPDIFTVFPRAALSAAVAGTGALFAFSALARLRLRQKSQAVGILPASERAGKAAAKLLALAASKRFFFAALFAGTLAGAVGVFRVHREALPPMTLCPLESVTSVAARLKGDPVPWGKDFYRAEASVIRFFSSGKADGLKTEFSASGNITLLIPAAAAEVALPGHSSAGRKPLYLANGAVIECSGAFSSSAAKKSAGDPALFRVSEILDAKPASSFVDKLLAARASLRLSLMKMLYGWGDAGGLFLALCSGMREFMAEEASDVFRRAGLSHILALSGMHLSILGGAITFICAKLAGRRLAAKISLFALALFLFFAGQSPSLLRAFLFSVTLAAVRRAGFRAELLPVLAFVFCAHVLLKPADFYAVSFQLSYLATAGIFSIGVFFDELLDAFIPGKLCRPLAASLGAQAAVFPVSMSVFAMFVPAGTIATLLLSAPISFFMISGICCTALSAFSPLLYSLCGLFMKAQYALILAVVSFFAQAPVITAGNNPLYAPFTMCVLFALFFVAGGFALRALRRKRMAGVEFSGL